MLKGEITVKFRIHPEFIHPALDTYRNSLCQHLGENLITFYFICIVQVTNISALKRFAANQSLTPNRATASRTNSLLIERNLEQDQLIWKGLPADG